MTDSRLIGELTVAELSEIVQIMADHAARNVPKTYFTAAAREGCDMFWEKKAETLGEALTGKNLGLVGDKQHVRAVYDHADDSYETAKADRKLFRAETIKTLFLAAGVLIALIFSYLGWTKGP